MFLHGKITYPGGRREADQPDMSMTRTLEIERVLQFDVQMQLELAAKRPDMFAPDFVALTRTGCTFWASDQMARHATVVAPRWVTVFQCGVPAGSGAGTSTC